MRDQYLRSSVSDPRKQTMPPDKQTSGNSAKPFTPSLSNSLRSGKSPLTPKLAGYSSSNTPRKPLYPSLATNDGSTRPDISTATPPLSSNVTPRSAPRTSRKDGFSSPVGTPTGGSHGTRGDSRFGSTLNTEHRASSKTRNARAKSVVKGEPSELSNPHLGTGQGNQPGPTNFFHASEARPVTLFSDQDKEKTTPSQKHHLNTTFLYADGSVEDLVQRNDTQTISSASKHSIGSRASTKPQDQLLSPRVRQSHPSSYPSRESTGSCSDQWGQSLQPMLDAGISGQQDHQVFHSPRNRVSSSGSSKRPVHTKSSSVDSSNQSSQPKPPLLASPISSPSFPSRERQGVAPSPDLSPRLASSGTSNSGETPLVPPLGSHSPVKEGGQNNVHLQNMNELAANARRERKVLDLEISNSSLLAINRTLEREMRKQNAELRRFRRLSRSGRISLNESCRSVSGGQLSVVSETNDNQSENQAESDGLSETSDDDSALSDGEIPSPNSVAEHDAKHRNRDERRFIQDLSKHQQLLIDSQKMSQSIKRCLGRTETLISEARKALEYHVQVSDVDIGGRVLSADEIGDNDEEIPGQGLLGSSEINELLGLQEDSDLVDITTLTNEP